MKLCRDDIKKLATSAGIKISSKYPTAKLCEMLDIPFVPGPRNKVKPFYVKNLETGQETKCKSRYAAMKELGINSGAIYQHAIRRTP